MRIFRISDCLWWICCSNVEYVNSATPPSFPSLHSFSFPSLTFSASSNLLACRTRAQILLELPSLRMGHPSDIFGLSSILDRSFLQIWKYMPYQSRKKLTDSLGSSVGIRGVGCRHAVRHTRILYPSIHSITTQLRGIIPDLI